MSKVSPRTLASIDEGNPDPVAMFPDASTKKASPYKVSITF